MPCNNKFTVNEELKWVLVIIVDVTTSKQKRGLFL